MSENPNNVAMTNSARWPLVEHEERSASPLDLPSAWILVSNKTSSGVQTYKKGNLIAGGTRLVSAMLLSFLRCHNWALSFFNA